MLFALQIVFFLVGIKQFEHILCERSWRRFWLFLRMWVFLRSMGFYGFITVYHYCPYLDPQNTIENGAHINCWGTDFQFETVLTVERFLFPREPRFLMSVRCTSWSEPKLQVWRNKRKKKRRWGLLSRTLPGWFTGWWFGTMGDGVAGWTTNQRRWGLLLWTPPGGQASELGMVTYDHYPVWESLGI